MSETTQSPEEITKEFKRAQRGLFNLAVQAAGALLAAEYDLVIVLAHGGFGPLWTLEHIWARTQTQPMPPILTTNFGREKRSRLKVVIQERFPSSWPMHVAHMNAPRSQGFALHWVTQQWFWHSELRAQIAELLGDDHVPRRILLLDELEHTGTTVFLFSSLLLDLFPNVTIRSIVHSHLEWRWRFLSVWMRSFSAIPKMDWHAEYQFMRPLVSLSSGMEDINLESLALQPISEFTSCVRRMSTHFPLTALLALPAWMKEQAILFVDAHLDEVDWGGLVSDEKVQTWHPLYAHSLIWIPTLVLKHAWNNGRVTRMDVMALKTGLPGWKATRILQDLVKRWVLDPVGKFGGRYYVPVSGDEIEKRQRAWYEANPPEPDEVVKQVKPSPGTRGSDRGCA